MKTKNTKDWKNSAKPSTVCKLGDSKKSKQCITTCCAFEVTFQHVFGLQIGTERKGYLPVGCIRCMDLNENSKPLLWESKYFVLLTESAFLISIMHENVSSYSQTFQKSAQHCSVLDSDYYISVHQKSYLVLCDYSNQEAREYISATFSRKELPNHRFKLVRDRNKAKSIQREVEQEMLSDAYACCGVLILKGPWNHKTYDQCL